MENKADIIECILCITFIKKQIWTTDYSTCEYQMLVARTLNELVYSVYKLKSCHETPEGFTLV